MDVAWNTVAKRSALAEPEMIDSTRQCKSITCLAWCASHYKSQCWLAVSLSVAANEERHCGAMSVSLGNSFTRPLLRQPHYPRNVYGETLSRLLSALGFRIPSAIPRLSLGLCIHVRTSGCSLPFCARSVKSLTSYMCQIYKPRVRRKADPRHAKSKTPNSLQPLSHHVRVESSVSLGPSVCSMDGASCVERQRREVISIGCSTAIRWHFMLICRCSMVWR